MSDVVMVGDNGDEFAFHKAAAIGATFEGRGGCCDGVSGSSHSSVAVAAAAQSSATATVAVESFVAALQPQSFVVALQPNDHHRTSTVVAAVPPPLQFRHRCNFVLIVAASTKNCKKLGVSR
ncbi:hypothetical protein DEO72_LG10g1891 [Vigna unguiculata]|uniref:Uncharacterized protein n=1 Tax=Vigna unguiculata TaxID=3917 RepID=A0A4D6N9W1_VIGUN|nr:hypothetical protein DEO72_LG10g1891 [Vigna unguiculata]